MPRWTADLVRALPDDGRRYELVSGEMVVTPVPRGVHQVVLKVLHDRIALVVEVTSPSTARYDCTLKRRRYQRAGVPEYWVVDSDARLVERWRPGDERPETLGDQLAWQPEGAESALELDLALLFEEATGEP